MPLDGAIRNAVRPENRSATGLQKSPVWVVPKIDMATELLIKNPGGSSVWDDSTVYFNSYFNALQLEFGAIEIGKHHRPLIHREVLLSSFLSSQDTVQV